MQQEADRAADPSSESLYVIRNKSKRVNKCYGCDHGISYGEGRASAGIVSFQETCETSHGPSNVVVFKAAQEFLGGLLFFRTNPGIDFGHVNGTAGQEMSLLYEAQKQLTATTLIV